MIRRFTLLNLVAVCLTIFMLIMTILNYRKNTNGWDIFALIMALSFSSLLVIIDYFIQAKIKSTLKIFVVELLALIVLLGLGVLISNN